MFTRVPSSSPTTALCHTVCRVAIRCAGYNATSRACLSGRRVLCCSAPLPPDSVDKILIIYRSSFFFRFIILSNGILYLARRFNAAAALWWSARNLYDFLTSSLFASIKGRRRRRRRLLKRVFPSFPHGYRQANIH